MGEWFRNLIFTQIIVQYCRKSPYLNIDDNIRGSQNTIELNTLLGLEFIYCLVQELDLSS